MSFGVMLQQGADLGPYHIEGQLAVGGMATVWRAHHREAPDEPVVLKTMLPHLARDRDCVAMFLREAELAARFDHPNIVTVHDVGIHGGLHFIEMELIEGGNLRQLLRTASRRRRYLPIELALSSVADACDGLAHVHDFPSDEAPRGSAGFVHRDISPENLVMGQDGLTRLVDFGVAAGDWVGATRAGQMKGKIHYMAPEVFRGQTAGASRDVYAAGVTLFELLVGRRPFHGENDGELMYQIAHAQPAAPTSMRKGLPPGIDELFAHATRRDPDERIDAMTLGERLREILETVVTSGSVEDVIRSAAQDVLKADQDDLSHDVVEMRSVVSDMSRGGERSREAEFDIFTLSRPPAETTDLFSGYGRPRSRPESNNASRLAPVVIESSAVRPRVEPAEIKMSNEARRHFEQGMVYRRQGRLVDALAEWEIAASLEPTHRTIAANVRLMRKKLRR